MIINKEAILRKEPKLDSEIIDILKENTEIVILEKIDNVIENEHYLEIKQTNTNIIGFVIESSVSHEKENDDSTSNNNKQINEISKSSKIKILHEVKRILTQKTSYAARIDNKYYDTGKVRLNGYYDIPYKEKDSDDDYFSYDCSSFCCTVLNRVFGINMQREKKRAVEIKDGISKLNVWVTMDFWNEVTKESKEKSMFDVIEFCSKEGEELDISKLEIGDFILGMIDTENEKHNEKFIMNHIMLYVGDGYIAHASYTDGTNIFNKVLLTKLKDNFYTKVSFDKRFDRAIVSMRYKENK